MALMKDARREKLEKELSALEAQYRDVLVAALTRCAEGAWGLFGQNDHLAGAPFTKSEASNLLALGKEIEALRNRLGLSEPFALHIRFLAERGRQHANRLGEPKLARNWLDELAPEKRR